MKKQTAVFFAAILALCAIAGCQLPESKGSVSSIRVFLGGEDATEGLTIEKGQTVTLKADTGVAPEFASIVWENESDNVEIVSSGEGPECVLKGKKTGEDALTVRAWRGGEKPVTITIPVAIVQAQVTNISIKGELRLGIGEKRVLEADISPAWAEFELEWSAAPAGYVLLGKNWKRLDH